MLVYMIENRINGKKYVGITKRSLQERLKGHCRKASREKAASDSYVCRAIHKHGIKNFEITQIDSAQSIDELYVKEKQWISSLGTYGKTGYNQTLGGEGTHGRFHSDQTKAKIREKAIERFTHTEAREKQREAAILWWKNYEDKEGFSEKGRRSHDNRLSDSYTWKKGMKAPPVSEESRRRAAEKNTGLKRTEEARRTISAARIGKGTGKNNGMTDPLNREKQRAACVGRRKMIREDGTWYWGRTS